jgi:hypothetical protein
MWLLVHLHKRMIYHCKLNIFMSIASFHSLTPSYNRVDDRLSNRIKRMRQNQWIYRTSKETDEKGTNDEEEQRNQGEEEDTSLLAYNAFMQEVIFSITKKVDSTMDEKELLNRIEQVIRVTVDISKNIYTLIDEAENASKLEDRDGNLSDLIYVTVNDLQRIIDTDIAVEKRKNDMLKNYLALMMEGVPEVQFDVEEDLILTSNPDILYLKSAIKLIYDIDLIHLEAYLWWSIVEEMILHTTSAMRNLYQDYIRIVTGLDASTSRQSHCTSSVNKLMGFAVSYLVVEKNFVTSMKPKVEEMLVNIRKSFNHIISHR